MKNRDYTVSRNDIYVGDCCGIEPEKIVIHPDGMFDYDAFDLGMTTVENIQKFFEGRLYLFKRNTEQLDYGFADPWPMGLFRRTMLFVLDENNHANDLLYDSPHYPIFNISSNQDCLNSPICIRHWTYQLSKVLEYFGYPEQLGYDDIMRIRKHLFSCDYVLDNCQLFGRYETDPHGGCYETYDSKGNPRTFNLIKEDSVLSDKYFDCIIHNKDHFAIDHSFSMNGYPPIIFGHVEDIFKPNEQEGPIRSLHK